MDMKIAAKLVVADAMETHVLTLSLDTRLDEALAQTIKFAAEGLVVVDKGGVVRGALEVRELLLAIVEGKKRKSLVELLVPTPVFFNSHTSLDLALARLKEHGLSFVPVVDGGQLRGIIQLKTIAYRLAEVLAQKDREFLDIRSEMERKDEYLGLVSHDMRAPITVIALSTDFLLADDNSRSMTADQLSFIERIRRNGETAACMIDDILEVVRLDRGFRLDYEKVLFSELLGECLLNLKLLAARKSIQFQVSHEQEIQVNLDAKRIHQVLENLIINAIKFSPDGGTVFVRSWLDNRPEGAFLGFQIKDQGEGIRKSDEAKLFKAFIQADQGITRKPGMGLGLAIVKKFVEFHHGSLELDGGWQKGASISVFLPSANALVADIIQIDTKRGPLVLLVEDDEAIREFYKQSLNECNYDVIEAGDGVEGFSLFQQHRVDLVLSDIRMPKMDGLELLAKIRMTGRAVPVILCSGYYIGLEKDLAQSSHKPDRIIDKPFKVKDMVQAIEEQLQRQKQAS